MDTLITLLLFIAVAMAGASSGIIIYKDIQAYKAKGVKTAGTLVVYTIAQDDESYLFLDTEMTPVELASQKEVLFKVETQNPQLPL